DALSHRGIAREAALLCGTSLKPPASEVDESDEPIENVTSIEILDPDLCPRYAGRVIRGVKVEPSPKWLADRLEAIGQRPVNNIADITNYVMFEMGQPTHAFDLNLLHEKRIIVRRALEGERIKTLDGFERELRPDMLVIADADRAVAMAGIMGGEDTEINARTSDVLLESAYFNPASVRQTARALLLDTEASYRFERGADFEAQVRAADRAAQLIAEIAGGEVLKGVIDAHPKKILRDPVALRESRIERLTGLRVDIKRAAEILRGLEFEVELLIERKELLAMPPSFRVDIFREEDLVEEVARHAGYELIEVTLPAWSGAGSYLPGEDRRRRVQQAMTGLGFDEAISFSFVDGERDSLFSRQPTLTLANPIDVSENEMRRSLVTGLMEALQRNFNHGRRDVKLFEMGRVFSTPNDAEGASSVDRGGRPGEREMLAIVLSGGIQTDDWRGARQADFYDLKGAIEAVLGSLNISGFTIEATGVEYLHPGQSAAFNRDGQEVARFGRLHPRVASRYKFRQPVYVGEIELEKLLELPADEVRYSPLPRLPSASRDVSALVHDEVSWRDIENVIGGLGIKEIVSVRLFDMYRGKEITEGFRSMAFRVTYRGEERTLTDEEVSRMHERVRQTLQDRCGAQLR
ncbi:MAG: phenylalanine--tRNA ligase subunit beta, partial [Blastocatellia bacterium]|nr:phenylalanine--tRNA ligase subunit beta [Blastocatellia bacterium]